MKKLKWNKKKIIIIMDKPYNKIVGFINPLWKLNNQMLSAKFPAFNRFFKFSYSINEQIFF